MRRYRLHPTLEFTLAHRPQQLFGVRRADQPPINQRDGVGMERVPTNTRDRAIKMRSEEHTSELQSLMRISYAVFCLKKKNNHILHLLIFDIILYTSIISIRVEII